MLDSDLAKIYGVQLKVMKQSVKRNMERFPEQFMWAVTERELESLKSQFAVTQNFDNVSEADARPQIRSTTADKQAQDGPVLELNPKFGSQIVTENFQNPFEADVRPRIRSTTAEKHSEMTSFGRRGDRYAPFVFIESGVAMLATVLRSPRAIQISNRIVGLFIELRGEQKSHPDLMAKLESMEAKFEQKLDEIKAQIQNPKTAMPSPAKQDSIRAILNAVARHFGLSTEDLKSPSRMQPIALARQIAVFFMKKHLGMGFSEIGRLLGGRDHTTILHAYRKIHVDSEDNDSVRKAVMTLFDEIQPLLS